LDSWDGVGGDVEVEVGVGGEFGEGDVEGEGVAELPEWAASFFPDS